MASSIFFPQEVRFVLLWRHLKKHGSITEGKNIMSIESERMLKELNKFLQEANPKDEADLNALMKQFNQMDHSRKPGDLDSYDLLEQAQYADTREERIRLAKKAMKMDPDNIEAEFMVRSGEAKDMDSLLSIYPELIEKSFKILSKQGITRRKDKGEFYSLIETRPLMRIYLAYIQSLLNVGRFGKAMHICEEVLKLNENDNMGVRYILMSLYAFFEDTKKAEALAERFEQEDCAFMLLPQLALCFKTEDYEKADRLLSTLAEKIPGGRHAFKELDDMEVEDILAMDPEYYEPYSVQEIELAYSENYFLYDGMPDFLPWVIHRYPKMKRKC